MIKAIRKFFGVRDAIYVQIPSFAKWDPTVEVKTTTGKTIRIKPPRSFYQAGTVRRFR